MPNKKTPDRKTPNRNVPENKRGSNTKGGAGNGVSGERNNAKSNSIRQDVFITPVSKKIPDTTSQFFKKHAASIVRGYVMKNPGVLKQTMAEQRRNTILLYVLVGSLFLNMVQAHYPSQPALDISLSNASHDIIHTTTLNVPPNTSQIILDWATRVMCSSVTMSFANFDDVMANNRQYFTPGGYQGFQNAMSDWLNNVVSQRLVVTAAPHGVSVISHMPSVLEPFWIVQVPMVFTFSAGSVDQTTASYKMATIKIDYVPPKESTKGHLIDSIILETGG